MSWIFGYINKNNKLKVNFPSEVKTNFLNNFKFHDIDIYIGGNSKNLVFNKNDNSGFIVSGIGIEKYNNSIKILDKEDWNYSIRDHQTLDGHFIIIEWDKDEIKIKTDNLGLRDIYIKETNEYIIFSTRIDWIAESGKIEIDFKEFGSRWLLFNQLSGKSIFKNIERITGGKQVKYNLGLSTLEYYDSFWLPDLNASEMSNEEFTESLKSLINIENQSPNILSLGLSGGMDSRVLLSLLMKMDKTSWETYSFGLSNHPDSIISERISKDFGIKHFLLTDSIPNSINCLKLMEEYICQTSLNNPGSSILQLQFYQLLHNNRIIVDGGFGEIWRREFFNRLLWKGKQSLVNHDVDSILSYLKIPRANIFTKEINDLMYLGCKEQLEELYQKIPSINEISVENWLDIFAIKTRLMNYYSHEQYRLDNLVTAYMPFAQISILNKLLSVPVKAKKNGRLFIDIIKNNCPQLTKYPRVKSNIAHPFWLNSVESRLWSLVRNKLSYKIFIDNRRNDLLHNLKEYIMDTLYSNEVKNNDIYDYEKIKNLTEGYFNGNPGLAEPLDWWLSFEILRKKVTSIN